MKTINVIVYPNCTWELEGDSFYCTHDEIEITDYINDHIGFDGHYQTEGKCLVCAECGEDLEMPLEEEYEN